MANRQKISLLLLAVAIFGIIGATVVSAVGPSNQKVEYAYQNGYDGRVYPVLRVPYPGECGTDKDDVILQYNTYWGPRVNPDNVRWSSDLWWVRSYISRAYSGGLSASGLSTTTTRVCMGTKGLMLGSDAELIYLWHK
jgi:hypothetical protein